MSNLNKLLVAELDKRVDDSFTSWDQLPNGDLMKGMREGVSIFVEAVSQNKNILFVHDSDVDGIGTYLLTYFFFRDHFHYKNFEIIITDRKKGYGFLPEYLNRAITPDLVITADNGITSHEACEEANKRGIRTIITDHHLVDKNRGLPAATCIIDPHQPGDQFPIKHISGTIVYWYFLKEVAKIYNLKIDMVQEFLPEMCLTTVSDMMPLVGLNRFIVKEGLKTFNFNSHRSWVKTFLAVMDIDIPTSEDLAFNLISALNAAARVADAEDTAIFMTREEYKNSSEWLYYLKELNDIRKNKTEILKKEMLTNYNQWLESAFIIIPGQSFDKGILGPLAGQLAKQYKRPAIVVSLKNGIYSGSGRSYGDIDLLSLVKDNPYVISNKTGGHKAACGVSFKEENLNDFWVHSQNEINKLDRKVFVDKNNEAFTLLDDLSEINKETVSILSQYEPYGQAFSKPILESNVKILSCKKIGTNKNHLSITIEDESGHSMKAMYFFFDTVPKKNSRHKITYTINKSTYGNEFCSLFINTIS